MAKKTKDLDFDFDFETCELVVPKKLFWACITIPVQTLMGNANITHYVITDEPVHRGQRIVVEFTTTGAKSVARVHEVRGAPADVVNTSPYKYIGTA